ncbi:MAG: ribonuclease P protein component [Silvanigrellales bacterium]|nr:ribonuclease P protein component [Silvanigrellales bacterium]
MLTARNECCHGKVQDFTALFEGGKRWKGRLFQAVYRRPLPSSSEVTSLRLGTEPGVRWAVIASKKGVDKRATRRNRVKRRLRALVREIVLPGFAANGQSRLSSPLEFALIASRRMLDEPWTGLEVEMRTFARVLKNSIQEPLP